MGILCANSAIGTMDDQLRLLVSTNNTTALYGLALGRRNKRCTTRPFTLNLPFAIFPLRNMLVFAYHTHLAFATDFFTLSEYGTCDKSSRAASRKV